MASYDLKLLDCTLRDGGYVNDWRFGFNSAKDIIKNLTKSNIDVVEVGFLRNVEKYNPDVTVCNRIEDLNKLLPDYTGNTMYSAMEEENAKNPEFDDTTINTVKTALMGPLSAIGDTLFPATLRILATSLVITMAAAGNVFAPILFLLIYNIPNYLARWYSLKYGYSMGMEFMVKSQKSGIMDKVSYACTVVGLMAIGAMIFYTVNISTPITIGNVKNGGIVLQTTLDTVMPGMLKIALVGIEYWLLKKGVKVVPLLIGTMAVGVLLFAIGAIA